KPLIPIAEQPIVHRLLEEIAKELNERKDEIAFIMGAGVGEIVETDHKNIAKALGARGTTYYLDDPLGTGHAIMCAKDSLSGPAVIAYADTLFKADFTLDKDADAVIWVKQGDNHAAYGVVKLNNQSQITDLLEKPKDYVSDLAVIGIDYFKNVEVLKDELQDVLDQNIIRGGEYQINDGIKAMKENGAIFVPGQVDEWMDCGNKDVTVETNGRMLKFLHGDGEKLISGNIKITNSEITEPCFIGENVVLKNAKIGPNVSLGDGTIVENSTIKNSLIQEFSEIKNAHLDNAMIGSFAKFNGEFTQVSIGDYSVLE